MGGDLIDGTVYVLDNLSPRSDPSDPWAAMGWGGIHGGDYNGSPLACERPSISREVDSMGP